MALIDTSELLHDSDFIDPMSIIHRKPYVDNFGQNRIQEQSIGTYGSVQPASGKMLERLPDALRVKDVSLFWVQGTIVADGKCAYPDLLVFKGIRYEVQTIDNWMNWGNGYCEGTCIVERPTL